MAFNYTFRYFDTSTQQLSYTVTTENSFPASLTGDADPLSIALVDGPVVQQDVIITGNAEFDGGTVFTGTVNFQSANVNLSLTELTDVDLSGSTLTKGDLLVYSGDEWNSFPIGLNDQILTANNTSTLGLEWVNGNERIGFEAYDSIGGQTSNTTVGVVLNINEIRTDDSNFDLNSNIITVNRTGLFQVIFRVSTNVNTGTSRSTSRCYLESDTGSGFAIVPGSFGYLYNRQATGNLGVNTATVNLVLQITSGDRFRILFNRENGNDTIGTIANASAITFIAVAGSGKDGAVGPAGPVGPPGSGSTVNVYNTGVPIPNSPFQTINFINPVTATFNSIVPTQVDISFTQNVISLYSTTTAVIGATETDLPFSNQNTIDTTIFSHSLNSPNVTINVAGRFDITGIVSTDGGGRTASAFVIKRSTGGGSFIEIPGTNGFMYNRSTTDGENTGVAKVIIDLNSGDIIKIQARRVGSNNGTISFINGGCSLNILKLQ